MTEVEIKAIDRLADAARNFAACVAEFFPQYPEEISESLDELYDAIDALELEESVA